jgi:hypothetical protein
MIQEKAASNDEIDGSPHSTAGFLTVKIALKEG